MPGTVFVSYVYEDHGYRDQVLDWSRKGHLGAIKLVFEAEDVRQRGDDAVHAHLRSVMRSADLILVLVGQDTHNRRWVDAEVHHFKSAGKPVVLTRLPGTTGAPPPEVRDQPVLPFESTKVRDALEALASR